MSTGSPDPAFASAVSFKRDGLRIAPIPRSKDGQPLLCIITLDDIPLRSAQCKQENINWVGVPLDARDGYSLLPFHMENGKYVTEDGAKPVSVTEKGKLTLWCYTAHESGKPTDKGPIDPENPSEIRYGAAYRFKLWKKELKGGSKKATDFKPDLCPSEYADDDENDGFIPRFSILYVGIRSTLSCQPGDKQWGWGVALKSISYVPSDFLSYMSLIREYAAADMDAATLIQEAVAKSSPRIANCVARQCCFLASQEAILPGASVDERDEFIVFSDWHGIITEDVYIAKKCAIRFTNASTLTEAATFLELALLSRSLELVVKHDPYGVRVNPDDEDSERIKFIAAPVVRLDKMFGAVDEMLAAGDLKEDSSKKNYEFALPYTLPDENDKQVEVKLLISKAATSNTPVAAVSQDASDSQKVVEAKAQSRSTLVVSQISVKPPGAHFMAIWMEGKPVWGGWYRPLSHNPYGGSGGASKKRRIGMGSVEIPDAFKDQAAPAAPAPKAPKK